MQQETLANIQAVIMGLQVEREEARWHAYWVRRGGLVQDKYDAMSDDAEVERLTGLIERVQAIQFTPAQEAEFNGWWAQLRYVSASLNEIDQASSTVRRAGDKGKVNGLLALYTRVMENCYYPASDYIDLLVGLEPHYGVLPDVQM